MGSFPYSPGMVPDIGDCAGGSPSGLIEKYLGEAYVNVLNCAQNMPQITSLITNLAAIQAVATAIQGGADFTAWTWGDIIGTLDNQQDLVNYITDRLALYQTANLNLAALAGLNLTGNAGRVLKVNTSENGLEWDIETGGSGGGGLSPANYGDISVNSDSTMTVNSVGGVSAATLITTVNGKINSSLIGIANGLATLDGGGKVPASQLPSYVDDVLEYPTFANFPGTGETGKIYIADDTGYEFRWTGTQYFQIVKSPGSTDALAEGSTNLYFTNARAQAALAASLGNKADLVGGIVPLSQIPASIPRMSAIDTGMEVGQYIDLHTSADGLDFQGRIQVNTSGYMDFNARGGLVTVTGSDLILNTNGKAIKFLGAAGYYSQIVNESNGNFSCYSTHADGTARPVWWIATHSDTSTLNIGPDVSMNGNASVGGNLTVTGEITSPSDIRLKEEIIPLLNASEIIAQLGGYRFMMDGREQIGVIAQQVLKVLPEIIVRREDGYLSVNYAKLTAVLIADNNAMRAKLNSLENRVARLEGR